MFGTAETISKIISQSIEMILPRVIFHLAHFIFYMGIGQLSMPKHMKAVAHADNDGYIISS